MFVRRHGGSLMEATRLVPTSSSAPPVQPQSWATGAPRPRGGGQLDDNQARPKKDLPLSKRKRVKCPLFNATEVLHINLPPLMAFFYHLQICKKNSQLLRKEIFLSLSCISNHNFLPFLQTNTWSMGGLFSTQRCQLIVYQGRARLWVSIYNAHQRLTNLLHPPCRHHHHHKGWVVTKQHCW